MANSPKIRILFKVLLCLSIFLSLTTQNQLTGFGSRILVVAGSYARYTNRTDLVDVSRPNMTCALPDFPLDDLKEPVAFNSAQGPTVCGGFNGFKIWKSRIWNSLDLRKVSNKCYVLKSNTLGQKNTFYPEIP